MRKPPSPPKKKAAKKSKRIQKAEPIKAKTGRGGARKGAGRKPKAAPRVVERAVLAAVVLSDVDALFDSLPLKQRNFIVNYLINGFNATKAAKKAGYSSATADSQGCRLLKDPKVRAVLDARTGKALEEGLVTADEVLRGIGRLARFDVRRLYRPDGTLKPIHELDDATAVGIAGIEVFEKVVGKGKAKQVVVLKKIKYVDTGVNWERLGRHHKLFTDRVEHAGEIRTVVLAPKAAPPVKKDVVPDFG